MQEKRGAVAPSAPPLNPPMLTSYQCDPSSIPTRFDMGARLSMLLVLALLRGFFFWFSSFLPSKETNTPNSNSARIEDPPKNYM